MKKRVLSLLLCGLMAVSLLAGCGSKKTEESADGSDMEYVKSKGTLVVGITDFEPMDYKDENGNWIGFDADKTIDCVWNGMTLTDEVKSAMECSNAYCNNAQIVIVPADKADQYQDTDSLKDLNFAVEAGSAGEAEVTALGLSCTPVKAQSDALLEVASGTSDAAVIDSLMAAAMVGEGTGYADLTYTVQLNSEEYGVGFRKGSDLAVALNDFFVAGYADGSVAACADTYNIQAALIDVELVEE